MTIVLKRGPKYPQRPEHYQEVDPKLRLAAARRAVARQHERHQETWGVLADVVPGPTETAEERVVRLNTYTRGEACQQRRDARAREWREVRALFRSIPAEAQAAVADEWNQLSFVRGNPSYLRYLIFRISPPPEEVERRRRVTRERIAFVRSRPRWIEHVGCGPLDEHAVGRGWTCLGCGWVIHPPGRDAIEAAERGELEWRYRDSEARVYQPALGLEVCP